jgi:hypothetical protein
MAESSALSGAAKLRRIIVLVELTTLRRRWLGPREPQPLRLALDQCRVDAVDTLVDVGAGHGIVLGRWLMADGAGGPGREAGQSWRRPWRAKIPQLDE